jgi:hypothetical protein
MPSIINTIFPVNQGFDTVPVEVRPPFSPGPGINEIHPVGVEAGNVAPGVGVAVDKPSEKSTPASVSAPNSIRGGAAGFGVGGANDSPADGSNRNSGDGPVSVLHTETALGTIAGGLLMPGGTPVNVVQNTIANQVFGKGIPQNVNGGRT